MDEFNISNFPLITQIRLNSFANGGRIRLNNERIQPKQQKGPTCGLVALSMCLEHFGVSVTVEQILTTAKNKGFSKQGEMYSANWLAELSNEFLEGSASTRPFPESSELGQSICDGNLLLIPYDCGPNYQPVFSKGHSAHWMLACGFVEKQEESGFHVAKEPLSSEEVAILGYQGKSTTLNIFPFSDVALSNSQLFEAGEKRDPDDYIIPNPNDLADIRNLIVEVKKTSKMNQ